MKLTRELKTGIVAISAIALFIWGYNFMKGKNLFEGNVPVYKTKFDNIQGLNTASKVTLNGVQVGKVQETKLITSPDHNGKLEVVVSFSVEQDVALSKKSIVKFYSDGLMGGKALAIIPSFEGEKAQSGDFFQGEVETDLFSSVTEKLNPLQAKIERMIVSADSLLVGLNDVLDTPTRNHLKASVIQLNQTMTNFKVMTNNINNLLAKNNTSINNTLSNAEKLTASFTNLSDSLNTELKKANLGDTMQELKTTIKNINKIVAGLDQGKGSMGKLLKDEKMYDNLTNASKELEELLREMKEHPKRFVHFSLFGKKDKTGYVKPEEDK